MAGIYPISFSIPECKILKTPKTKVKDFATIIPGDMSTYIFNDEKSYYEDYAVSIFGKTCKKGGWDCMRHYEIMANGCIPWFDNLENCPKNTLTIFPRQIMEEAKQDFLNKKPFNMELSQQILDFTREFLSTKAMATYILRMSGHLDAKSCLFLSDQEYPDYLNCLTLHGFKELFGKECHDFVCIPYLYTNYPHPEKLYGKGFTYSCLLDKEKYRNNEYDKNIEEIIKSHYFDIIIFGSIHRTTKYWSFVNRYYKETDIITLCGEDEHICDKKELGQDYPLFVREL